MTHLTLRQVSVDYPVFRAGARSLRRALLEGVVGGGINRAADGCIFVRALSGIDLDLREGDRVALIGHNGAGKTTLLRVLGGIYHPTAGAFEHAGRRALLFDISSGLDEEATGHENILLRGLLMGLSRVEIARRTTDIAAFSGLGDYLDLPVRTYSTGMLLRLLFSIATSGDAEITLMDEWIASGDESFLDKANRRLGEFVGRSRILVFASHNPELLRQMCNKGVLLENGKLVMTGTVDAALAAYQAAKPDDGPKLM